VLKSNVFGFDTDCGMVSVTASIDTAPYDGTGHEVENITIEKIQPPVIDEGHALNLVLNRLGEI
jgi:hypothetical protein